MIFGRSGVGKSTISGLLTTVPGLFAVGSSFETTTIGSWISTALNTSIWAEFAKANLLKQQNYRTERLHFEMEKHLAICIS